MVVAQRQALTSAENTSPPVVALRVVTDAGDTHGAAVLIHRDDRAEEATLYFLTSARLFRAPDGERTGPAKAIQLRLRDTLTLDVKPEDVLFAGGGFVDLAMLRGTVANTEPFRPVTVVYDPPAVGAAFLLSGVGEGGAVQSVAQRIRFESTMLVVGDRDASRVSGCLGAAAISSQGVFGVVRECEPNRPPVISLLSMAQSWLDRCLARPTTVAAMTPRFGLVERQIADWRSIL